MRRVLLPLLCLFLPGVLVGCGEVLTPAAGTTAEPKSVPQATAGYEGAPGEVTLGEESNGQEVSVEVDHVLNVVLPGNPSTGYSWLVSQVDAAVLLQEGEAEFIPSSSDLVGAPGQVVLHFRALQAGRTTLVLDYRRSWEQEATPMSTFSIQVTVR
jgi:inhibitor of cysteine peptidase